MTAGPYRSEGSFKAKELGIVMKVIPVGMHWMISAGWLNHRPRAAWRALEVLSEGLPTDGMNKFTLLAHQGIGNEIIEPPPKGEGEVVCRERLGGL